MADLTLAATVTRQDVPGGPLADLSLHSGGVYDLVSVDRGSTTKRRVVATSRFVDGGANVSAVKDMSALTLIVRVLGDTLNDVDSRVADLRTAFDQSSYTVTITIDGVTQAFTCWDFDSEQPVDGEWDKFSLANVQQVYRYVLPRQPSRTGSL